MSARVYLFADFGKGPRVVKRSPSPCIHRYPATLPGCGNCLGSGYSVHVRIGCAWWLVECEIAEAGRVIIAAWSECGPSDRGSAVYHDDDIGGRFTAHPFTSHQAAYVAGFSYVGRIIASGGAA